MFDHQTVERLCEEFMAYKTIGHVTLLCARPDFMRHLTFDQKSNLVSHYETLYDPERVHVGSVDHANAHLGLELQRGAHLLSSFAVQQLHLRQRDDLLAVVRGSHLASPRDPDFSRLDLAHRLVQASPPTHADAPAPLLPPETPLAH